MDAVVIVDPVQYQHRRDERDDVYMPLRALHFGPDGAGLVTFLVYRLMTSSCGQDPMVRRLATFWLSSGGLAPRARPRADRRAAVTFCSWYPVITMECVDRFVDRAIGANGAIRAIDGTALWYPCR
jgi:hypothetical protein